MFSFDIKKKPTASNTRILVPYRDRAIVDLIAPNLENGPWIAGGACIKWFNKQHVRYSDIDVFVRDMDQVKVLINKLNEKYDTTMTTKFIDDPESDNKVEESNIQPIASSFSITKHAATVASTNTTYLEHYNNNSGSTAFRTKNAITFKKDDFVNGTNNLPTVQIIIKTTYQSVQQVIDNFDIRVCKIATDGYKWVYDPMAISDINNKKLAISIIHDDTLKRFVKYWSYGFQPDQDAYNLIKNHTTKWHYEAGKEYDEI